MDESYTAVIEQSEGWWIGWMQELPGVNCQELTREALLESLREALSEALDFNRENAPAAAGELYEEQSIGRRTPSDASG